MTKIKFEGKTFCFTGKLAELKRTIAEREVRSRAGFSQKVINKQLDFLVIGSVPSTGWKHGNYGNKIEKARQLIMEGAQLLIIPENKFMEALENYSVVDNGEINHKLIICRYKALFQKGEINLNIIEKHLQTLEQNLNSHVIASIEEPYVYKDLYNEFNRKELENCLLFRCRIIKQFDLNYNGQEFIDQIAKGFEGIENLDGDISWSEKKEGSASFAKLLKEIKPRTTLT